VPMMCGQSSRLRPSLGADDLPLAEDGVAEKGVGSARHRLHAQRLFLFRSIDCVSFRRPEHRTASVVG
jgi:hypothetical protein